MAIRRVKRIRDLGDILASGEMQDIVQGIADRIASHVSDPDPRVAATLRTQVFITTSSGGAAKRRAVGQVGIAPYLAGIEAKRGPLAKAKGSSGA